ncbi:caffeoylshikimate esterase-like isoform X1 [Arachis stenosperma]|uniref:caffeoylshikimate esterase-like isoform X1 n=1 Tax=Arachis stenosperma TaxID=217475 RepID=UPI0025AC2F5D|nr:caffeoylshikimate esterase-like isoform X1 [Arachis stenosperma]
MAGTNDEANIIYEEEYVLNSRGMKLFASRWLPANGNPKAIIFMCHGYAMECSITMNSTGRKLANAGYAVYGVDYEGHGKSDGRQGLVLDFNSLINDCCHYFTTISEKKENKKKMRFLLGESMGGAVALLLHWKKPDYWDGAILVAPMCKIADDLRPNAMVVGVLSALSRVIPSWRLIPTQDIIDVAFKEPQVRQQVIWCIVVQIRANEYCYKGKPRLRTGYELLRVSTEIEQRLNEVSLPFLVLHGEEDQVTDKAVSKQLYEVASSTDKTIKLYPGMWHGLLYGEPPENLNIVFSDIIGWLDHKSQYGNTRIERELKQQHEDNLKP